MKISVVTATYNSGRTLRATMESVLSQNYPDWEHIIIDGGSTDDTVTIIREMAPRYGNRLKWVSEPDNGIYDAMNKGFAMADGDVMGILSSDDFFSSPRVLERVAREMQDEDIEAVYGDVHYVNDSDLTKCTRYYSSRYFRRWLMLMGYQPAHPSFYCRRSCYERLGAFDTGFKVAADFELMLRMIYINRIPTRYIPMDFVTMRTGGASTAGLVSHRRILIDHHNIFAKHSLRAGYFLDPLRYPLKAIEVSLGRISLMINR